MKPSLALKSPRASVGHLSATNVMDVSSEGCPSSAELFQAAIRHRQGSVLTRGTILKRDHFPHGTNFNLQYHLEGAPNFRKTDLNIYGVSQPTKSGLSTVLTLLNYNHEKHGNIYWFNTREEPVLYINGNPFVLRDAENPKQNIRTYSGITSERLEQMESRLKDDVVKEAIKSRGLILVHDELDDGTIIYSWISADVVETSRDVFNSMKSNGFNIQYSRIPVSPEQRPDDKYLDEYLRIVKHANFTDPIVFNCGLGVGRTTFGMVAALLIRNYNITRAGSSPDDRSVHSGIDSEVWDNEMEKKAILRLVYVLERGLNSKMTNHSAVEWALARGSLIDHLKNAILGNYTIIQAMASVLENGQRDKKVLDKMIDRCDALVNLREEILMNRVRYSVEDKVHVLETARGFLERYLFLLAFASYINNGHFQNEYFSEWLLKRNEVWNMLQSARKKGVNLYLFRPVEDLSQLHQHSVLSKGGLHKNELENVVIRNRNGVVLGAQTILKVDHWVTELIEKSQIDGAPNFRRIGDFPLFAVAQPTLTGMRKVVDLVKGSTTEKMVWLNLREEPLIYINGCPYVLRDEYFTLRNLKSFVGITQQRLDLLESRLKDDILKEIHHYEGKVLLHEETKDGQVVPIWTSVAPEEVMTFKEVVEQLKLTYTQLEYFRVPITAEAPPEEKDFDEIMKIITSQANQKSVVMNCQMGLGRSTTGTVIASLVTKWLRKREEAVPTSVANTTSYQIIHSLLRVIRNGLECKYVVDVTIDECASHLNIREIIEDWRIKSDDALTDEERQKFFRKGVLALKRYFYLIAFEAYINSQQYDNMDQMMSFVDWFGKHEEFQTMLKELDSENKNLLLPVHHQLPGDGVALTSEVLSVVQGRRGAVLAQQMILKYDHFPGCQKLSLTDRIDGAPNFRGVKLPQDDTETDNIYGVAMPTKSAIYTVLNRINAKKRILLWTSLREEPVVYINGRPFVLRLFQDPLKNLETTGIERERVESMEARMKNDIIEELKQYGGRVLLHEEESAVTGGFQVVPVWETVKIEDVQTPSEVFEGFEKEGYHVKYLRIPITDEQAPIPKVFDLLISQVLQMNVSTSVIFNCQMGRGRTTTGMVIAYMMQMLKYNAGQLSSIQSPTLANLDAVSSNEDLEGENRERARYLNGEYKIILQLVSVLQFGIQSKRMVDHAVDVCSHIQNIRAAIFDYKLRLEAISATEEEAKRRHTLLHVGVNYLIRYFFLITFASYLLEKCDNEREGKSNFPSFSGWLDKRKEIYNIINQEDVDLS